MDACTTVQNRRSGGFSLLAAARIARTMILLFFLTNFTGEVDACPQADSPSEYQVKAAFLYNFAKFVEWPPLAFPDSQAPFVFGIVGDDPFEGELAALISGKSLNGRSFTLRRFRRTEDLRQCHLLFIGPSERKSLPEILSSLQGASVLTVADIHGFARLGGMIGFVRIDNHVRLEINPRAAERCRIKISSRLLVLAHIVGTSGTSSN